MTYVMSNSTAPKHVIHCFGPLNATFPLACVACQETKSFIGEMVWKSFSNWIVTGLECDFPQEENAPADFYAAIFSVEAQNINDCWIHVKVLC